MIEDGGEAKRELKEKWLELELERLRLGRGREMHLNPHWSAFVRVFFRGAIKFLIYDLRFTIAEERVHESGFGGIFMGRSCETLKPLQLFVATLRFIPCLPSP